MNIIEKEDCFYDKLNEKHTVKIRIIPNVGFNIESFYNNEKTGYIMIYIHPDNKLYLDVIYCYDKYRNRGIATKLMNIAENLLHDYDGWIIRGSYEPSQLSTDRENNIFRDKIELEESSKRFYESCGYKILNLDDYLQNPLEYSDITAEDFQLSEEKSNTIIYKKIGIKNKVKII